MKKIFLLFFVLGSLSMSAQVTIGSDLEPEKKALLDIKTISPAANGGATTNGDGGGLLLPRVILKNINSLEPFFTPGSAGYDAERLKHKGLTVYNIQDNTNPGFAEGQYVWDGEKWTKIGGSTEDKRLKFFYMPSVPIPTTKGVTHPAIELHTVYSSQFNSPLVKSDGAPASIHVPYAANELYYYVTSYDPAVFAGIAIDAGGKMTYTINQSGATTSCSFINIVFVVK